MQLDARHFVTPVSPISRSDGRGFSLIELLAVIAVISILLSLLLPALAGFSSTAGRRGAVNTVMGTLDQARVAALERGRNVHVVMARRQHPETDALLVMREDDSGNPSEQLTRWVPLPKGVLFQGNLGVFFGSPPENMDAINESLPPLSGEPVFAVLTFGPSGTILWPVGTNNNSRRIHLLEGVRNGEVETPRTQGVEVISVARYTGRPQLDISFQ